MELDCFSCPICISPYDKSHFEPRIIPNCGHSLCLHCLNQILGESPQSFKCPLCARPFYMIQLSSSHFPKNFLAINLIEESSKSDRCQEHKATLDLICVDCKTKICNKCVFKGTHKDHKVDIHEDFV